MFRQQKKVTTRMAPSPTGHLHVGTARAALYNFLYAKRQEGVFILRSEDTDKSRSTEVFEKEIKDGLAWLGISWNEYYRQSERTEIYKEHLNAIIKNGNAYISKEQSKRDANTEVEVIRLKNPNKQLVFEDMVRGEVTFNTSDLGDFVIARSIDDPLYHFAVVVDDHEMDVTHVIRGEDHISNTPRQILIQEALGIARPLYAHLPLLLAPDRSKLSKRHGAVSLQEYIDDGYLPVAITNYLALLGWNPGTDQEIFTLKELSEQFELEGVQKGGAIFDIEKLKWVNREHLLRMSKYEFEEFVKTWIPENITRLPQYSDERLQRLTPIIRERVHTGADIRTNAKEGEYDFAFEAPHPTLESLKWKNDESVKDALPRLQKLAEKLSSIPENNTPEEIKNHIWTYAEEIGRGEVLWPLRVALSGKERSPDPFAITHVIGTAEAYKRVQSACDTILSA